MGITSLWGEAFVDVGRRASRVFKANWHLGLTAFGGPSVHFKIVSRKMKSNSLTFAVPKKTQFFYLKNLKIALRVVGR
jgi:hypothetical protein